MPILFIIVALIVGGSSQAEAVKVRACKPGIMGYLGSQEVDGGTAFYLMERARSSDESEIVCGIRAGQLVQALAVDKEL